MHPLKDFQLLVCQTKNSTNVWSAQQFILGLISIKALKIWKLKPGLTRALSHAAEELQIILIYLHKAVIGIQERSLFTSAVL